MIAGWARQSCKGGGRVVLGEFSLLIAEWCSWDSKLWLVFTVLVLCFLFGGDSSSYGRVLVETVCIYEQVLGGSGE